jgi:hypothetical protein
LGLFVAGSEVLQKQRERVSLQVSHRVHQIQDAKSAAR